MRRNLAIVLLCISVLACANAQRYTQADIFAHNDYVRPQPFYTAYNHRVGYIEADVFLHDGDLMVAHHKTEIVPGRNLESLYLQPLSEEMAKNGGFAYADRKARLTLMIDLKTEGVTTLNALTEMLQKYRDLTTCKTLQILISGDVPSPDLWKNYPSYIYFDGRPSIQYSKEQLKRVALISTGFGAHSKWDGRGSLSEDDRKKIGQLMDDAHKRGKKFRFWATPDFPEAWKTLMAMKMDVLVTDDVEGLAVFIKNNTK